MLWLYSLALSLSAALLFGVEPMIAKMILPYLGGTPAVWNTCLFFFQTFLLAGYAYAHFAGRWLGTKRHAILHLALASVAVVFLPVTISFAWFARPDPFPEKLVLSVLLFSIGFPFFVLSASSPLLQKWFAATGHSDAQDPYFLYSASNLGSFAGLVAYPLLLEPNFTLAEQSRVWLYGYLAFLVATFACGFSLVRAQKPSLGAATASADVVSANEKTLTTLGRLRCVGLSFAPSSLLLGVTTYVTTDLSSVPLLWVIPLALYLISFVIAFQRNSWASHPYVVRRQGFLLLAAAVTFFARATEPAVILLPLHLLAFFVTALVCHGELAKERPGTASLTEFYLWISVGGVLGGFFNAFLAPALFNGVQEYPLAMIVAALLRPGWERSREKPKDHWLDLLLPAGLGLTVFLLVIALQKNHLSPRLAHLLIFGLSGVLGLSFARRPIRFGLGLAAVMAATYGYYGPFGNVLYAERSFFGVYRAALDQSQRYHVAFHGTTLHGEQSLDPTRRLEPLAYYYRSGPVGHVFGFLRKMGFNKPVAIIGLGAGSIACYGRPGEEFVFYEIDPLVERMARNPKLFTFLRDCPPRTSVIIGDARITLTTAPSDHYGMLIVDAFSGDAIPIHLLTREAVELYLSKITSDGMLLFHVSNRYMDLPPVLDKLSAKLRLTAFLWDDERIDPAEEAAGKQPSRWVFMTRSSATAALFAPDTNWTRLGGQTNGELWTDDHSNILQALRWR